MLKIKFLLLLDSVFCDLEFDNFLSVNENWPFILDLENCLFEKFVSWQVWFMAEFSHIFVDFDEVRLSFHV